MLAPHSQSDRPDGSSVLFIRGWLLKVPVHVSYRGAQQREQQVDALRSGLASPENGVPPWKAMQDAASCRSAS